MHRAGRGQQRGVSWEGLTGGGQQGEGQGRGRKVASAARSSGVGTEGAGSSADPDGGLGTRLRAPGGRTGGSSPGRR